MEIAEIINAVANVGFPIGISVVLMWYCKSLIEKQNERFDKISERMQDRDREYLNAFSDIKITLEKIIDKIKGDN